MQSHTTIPPLQVDLREIFYGQGQCSHSAHTTPDDATKETWESWAAFSPASQHWMRPYMAGDHVDQDQYVISTAHALISGSAAAWVNTISPHQGSVDSNRSPRSRQIPEPPRSTYHHQQPYTAGAWPPAYHNVPQAAQFDIFQALRRLATRQDPRTILSAVDMSDSFVVADLWQQDMPIVYVSDNFEVLTGYSRQEALGRNTRFLQSPDGAVQAGAARDHISSISAWELKQQIAQGREFQYVVKNFRKDGAPFLNLLTIIPLPEDTPEIRYMFGVQTELSPDQGFDNLGFSFDAECLPPNDSDRCPDGYLLMDDNVEAAEQLQPAFVGDRLVGREGRNISADTTAALLAQLTSNDLTMDSEMLDSSTWNTMLLENIDGLVHVLSSKGVFVYVSPTWTQLGYRPTDLVGTSIKDICHPADVLALLEEIENAKSRKTVDLVFRLRHSDGHYCRVHHYGSMWDDGGTPWLALVGRPEPVVDSICELLEGTEFLGDEDVWIKITTSGLVLAVFSSPRNALGISPDDVVGTTFQNMIQDKQSRHLFQQMLNDTRKGHRVSQSFKLQAAESQNMCVETTLFSGDMSPSGKPCFLLVRCRIKAESSLESAEHGTSSSTTPTGTRTPQRLPIDAAVPGDNLYNNNNSNHNINPPFHTDAPQASTIAAGPDQRSDLKPLMASNKALGIELRNLRKLAKQRKRARMCGTTFSGCVNCGRTHSPEWRKGPDGERNLCNRCGLRYARSIRGTSLEKARRPSAQSDTAPDAEY